MQFVKKRLEREYAKWKNKGKLRLYRGAYTDKESFYEGRNILYPKVKVEGSFLGFGSYVGNSAKISYAKIGRYTCIGPEVKIIYGQHPISFASIHPAFYSLNKQAGFTYIKNKKFEEYRYADEKHLVVIGNDVWIGDSAKIMEGVRIGDGAVVAADALVTKDVEPYTVVGGIPAKTIRQRFSENIIEQLLKLSWWDRGEEWIYNHAELFDNVELFLEHIKNEEKL